MVFYRHLFVHKRLQHTEQVLEDLKQNKFQPPVYLIVLSDASETGLEIINTLLFLQNNYPMKDDFVVGIAKDHRGALETVEEIVQTVYNETKGTDVRAYIQKKEQEEEP